MSQVINTNIASLTAQRNLNSSQGALQTSLERLSSGLRINSAKDDAAGLAISERFTAQINGLQQAQRNANDGISLAQTAEGALNEIGNSLQRIRELAVQSANDTNSSSDRQALNAEAAQLIAEINRISSSTQFNGQNVLDGSLSNLNFQVGANQGQQIQVNGVDARGSRLGAEVFEGAAVDLVDFAANSSGAGNLTLNGVAVDLSSAENSTDIVNAINAIAADSGVTAQKAPETSADLAFSVAASTAATFTLNDVGISIAGGTSRDDAIDEINKFSNQTGVTATADGAAGITLTATGSSIELVNTAGTALGATATFDAGIVLATDVGGTIVTGGSDSALLGFGAAGTLTTTNENLNNVSLLTNESSGNALRTLDFALNQVNSLRADLGAVQTRFESTIANLSVGAENLSGARSRIVDADFAAETAALTRAQILQQAGTSVLAQANQIPQNVLSLLQ